MFVDLGDGGRVILDAEASASPETVEQIRTHMRDMAVSFKQGDFLKPFHMKSNVLPGVPLMVLSSAQLFPLITYTAVDRPRGAEVRIWSRDPITIGGIHDYLEFQRTKHRAPSR